MASSDTSPDADVLVVGVGPVGGVLAALLASLGVRVLVIERECEIYRLPRAAHFDHEIMRIFQQVGIAAAVEADARVVQAYEFRNAAGDVLVRFDLRGRIAESGWPASYLFHQPTMEAALRERLAASPLVVLRTGWSFVSLQNDDEATAKAIITDPSGDIHVVAARFVVGCDGASSTVRQSLGVSLEDYGFEKPWLVVDTSVPDESGLPQFALQICDPARPTTVMPMSPGRRRWEFMLMPGENPADMLAAPCIDALLRPHVAPEAITIVRKAVYVFHGLVAEHWRRGHVLLAGDAAHQMPPFMGQGMCSGLRDAANLAWKLAMVLRGEADAALLDTYQQEREPHVRSIIAAAIALGEVVCERDPAAAAVRDATMMAARARDGDAPTTPPLPPLAGGLLFTSPLAGTIFPQVPVRLPDGRFGRLDDLLGSGFLLLARDEPPDNLPAWLRTFRLGRDLDSERAIEAWLGGAAAVLVRPDHIVFGTGEPAALADVLKAMLM